MQVCFIGERDIMLYTYPDYYDEFKCIADKCEATCCAGWQIMIDDNSFEKYRRYEGTFKTALHANINWKEQCFKQKINGRCSFLNKNNLCDMQLAMGENNLCKICGEYPRHIEEFENVREVMLSVSCPVVAEMLMSNKKMVTLISREDEQTEEFEEFDELFYSLLNDARDVIISVVQNRTLPIDLRMYLTLAIAHDLQGRINRGQFFSFDEVFEKYMNPKVWKKAEHKLCEFHNKKITKCNYTRKIYKELYKLEHLVPGYGLYLRKTEQTLYGRGVDFYCKTDDLFKSWCLKNEYNLDIKTEQLLVYFIYTYFCGSVYDGAAYDKAYMCVMSPFLIYEMAKAKWIENKMHLSQHDLIKIVYTFSRELEHSDINLDRFEKCVKIKLTKS